MRIMRFLVGLLLLLLVVIVAGVGYVILGFPKVSPAPEMAIEATPERLERGRYLAEHVMGCKACHSQPRVDRYSFPPVADTAYGGGYRWGPEEGLPGVVVSANLTPHALGDWSDGEIHRAISSGVSRDGEPLFSLMPYPFYAKVDAEDISAVVIYLRSLSPVVSSPPRQQLDPFMSLIVRTMPSDPSPRRLPDGTDTVALGEYLATAALCEDCHTDFAGGRFIGTPFAGGRAFPHPGLGLFRSANITPHAETGIGAWSRQDFIARFKAQPPEAYDDWAVVPGEENTIMPWWAYAGMTERDLGAIYDYLQSLPATENVVETFAPLPEGG